MTLPCRKRCVLYYFWNLYIFVLLLSMMMPAVFQFVLSFSILVSFRHLVADCYRLGI